MQIAAAEEGFEDLPDPRVEGAVGLPEPFVPDAKDVLVSSRISYGFRGWGPSSHIFIVEGPNITRAGDAVHRTSAATTLPGPWTPIVRTFSMSAVRLGPVMSVMYPLGPAR